MRDQNLTGADIIFDDEGLPFATAFGDHYYSRHDGRAETEHVFLAGNHVAKRWEELEDGQTFTIGELGFGTGLNFLVTWFHWNKANKQQRRNSHFHFVSVEAFPMDRDMAAQALKLWPELAPLTERLFAHWPFQRDKPVVSLELDDTVVLTVHHGEAKAMVDAYPFCDAWYLDGFAPARNDSMWSAPLLQKIYDRTKLGGTFSSYTAAGKVRRDLAAAGFYVEKRKGFGTKRDMIVGHKPILSSTPDTNT